MKHYLLIGLRWLTKKLEGPAPARVPPPPPRAPIIAPKRVSPVILRDPSLRARCPVMDKVSRTEHAAKFAAKKKSNQYTKIRAYKCEYCPAWHLTHQKDKLRLH